MQLKMEKKNKFDRLKFRNILEKESKFIGHLFSIASIPTHDYDEVQDDVFVGQKKPSKEEARNIHRAKTFQELNEKLQKIKGAQDFSIKSKKAKKKLGRKIKKQQKKEERKKRVVNLKKTKKDGVSVKEESMEDAQAVEKVTKPTKPVFNSQGRIVFSKFDFSHSGIPEDKKKGERDPRRLLENLQKQKETVKELREAGDTDKAALMMEKISWKNALAKAEGQKVKDDPLLLKKTVKKQEQRKKQSSKKWESRLQGVQKAKDDRQKKRETNLLKRKQDKKSKVMKKAQKKGRLIP